jgi:hypothetical protein
VPTDSDIRDLGIRKRAGVTMFVAVDEAKLKELQDLCRGQAELVPKILARAVNKVGVAARTEIVREVASQVNVKIGELKARRVTLSKAYGENPEARIRISGRRIPLQDFGARQTKKGVSYAIRKGGRKVFARSFQATMASGHVGVFTRAKAESKAPRLPIFEKAGPSIGEVVSGIESLAQDVFDRRVADDLAAEIDNQVGLMVRKN